jgi:hypothetical protein
MKRGTYQLPKTPLPLRGGMSNQDYEAREAKQRIYEDLLRKQDELNTSLTTMLQVGPEFDKTIAEIKRIDRRLENFSSPETYNDVRIQKSQGKKQKQAHRNSKDTNREETIEELMEKASIGDLLDKTLSPIRPTNLNSVFSSPEKNDRYRLQENNRYRFQEIEKTEKKLDQEFEIATQKTEQAIKKYQDLKRTQATDLNSVYSSPEPIFNTADSMSYLNPQESKIPPRTPFSNTPFINAEPSLSNPIYDKPLMPRQTTTFNTTAIKPRKINDELVATSYKDYLNYYGELTKLPTEQKYGELANMEVKAAEGDVEDVNKARQELETLHGRTDEFFDGNDLFPKQDFDLDAKSGFTKMSEAQNEYDMYRGTPMDKSIDDVLSSMGLGDTIDGLNLSGLGDSSLFSRTNTNQSGRDPYVNTNTNNLAGDLVSSINFNNLLLGENSIYNRTRDLDLLSVPSEDGNDPNDDAKKDPTNSGTSLNFKSLNKRQMGKNFKASKWQGLGQRPSLRPTLSDVRSSNVDFKIPSMTYKGSQVNLVRRANRTTDMLNSEFEP